MRVNTKELITKSFPFFEDELVKTLLNNGHYKRIEANTEVMRIGDKITFIPLVISGLIKVMRQDENGQEILLYFLKSGEVCSTTLSCCMDNAYSNIIAITEEDAEIFFIPVNQIDNWMGKYPTWKKFIMLSFRARFDELLQTIDSIAFMKMDQRLIKFLMDQCSSKGTKVFYGTHQEIASQLNTSREVISRLLKQLEKDGKVTLSRNRVDITGLCD